jgi:hypothetical protein
MPFKPTALDHERIKIMGNMMLNAQPGFKTACCVDADDGGKYQGKGDWYEEQFKKQYPAILITYRGNGPTQGCQTIILEAPPCRQRPSNN